MIHIFLKKMRRENNMTLQQLADKVGYGTGNLSSYETGRLRAKDATVLRILTRGFDMTESQARTKLSEMRQAEFQSHYGNTLSQSTKEYNNTSVTQKEVLQYLIDHGITEKEVHEILKKLQ